jgi:hypothetical protein
MFPSCCSCGGCEIGTDAFDGSLSQWSTTGSPSTSGGLLTMTSGDRVIFTPEPASASSGVHVETHPETADGTAKVRLIAGYTDASNYLFGELAIAGGEGTLRLGEKIAGTESWLTLAKTVEDTGSELNDRSTLELCWTPGAALVPEGRWQGPAFPRSARNAAGPEEAWINEGNIQQMDSTSANCIILNDGDETRILIAETFGINVPAGSTIDGIKVGINCEDASTSNPEAPSEIEFTEIILLDGSGASVGDNKAPIGTPIPLELAEVTVGGSADDWNAGLTWEDVNSPLFGVAIKFTWDDSGATTSRGVDVDYVALTLWYTTPDRRAGRLRLAYTNTAAPNATDCVTDLNVTSDDGLKTGIEVTAGSFDFTDYTLSYQLSDSRPSCPDCGCTASGGGEPCGCCDDEPEESYVIDMGGTLSDDECECSQIPQSFVVDNIGECVWGYEQEIDCDDEGFDHDAIFAGTLRLLEDETGCYWEAYLHITGSGTTIQDPSNPDQDVFNGAESDALYESDYITAGDCFTDLPMTLNLIAGDTAGVCSSAWPASITLDLA